MPGARKHFSVKPKNPNGRGGCVCSPSQKIIGCDAPFIVFTHAESLDFRNPYTVMCMTCANAAAAKCAKTATDKLTA